MRTAEVFINLPTRSINNSFTYIVPESLDYIGPGWRVLVPFGNRKTEGFVVSVGNEAREGLKPILEALDVMPWFDEPMLSLAAWLSDYYLCTMSEAMRLFIPGKSGMKIDTLYHVTDDLDTVSLDTALADRPAGWREIVLYLAESGSKTQQQITNQFGENAGKVLRQLVQHKLVQAEQTTRKTARPQYKTEYRLAVSRETAADMTVKLKGKSAQVRLLNALLTSETLSADAVRELKISGPTLKSLLAAELISAVKIQVYRDSYANLRTVNATPQLTPEQQEALNNIVPSIVARQNRSYLLHGITGSGKTQVYIEAVAAARQAQRQAVVLVPEIALTGQIVSRFKERFGADVVVLHSKLSVGERHDTWQRLREGNAGIVIGARSAVFAPVPDPGVFIIDEEHEFTYKQEETPRYHTRDVALKRAELAGAAVVLGSATPSIETYFQAAAGEHTLLEMPRRIDGATLPEVTVVDMREELKEGRRSVISAPLRELLLETLARREQAIILLNRRGYATFVICRECGHVMRCSHCAVSLVYHASGVLRCHYCQGTEPSPDTCPQCRSRYIRYFGTGTQKVEAELAELLPNARIIRMDQDTTSRKTAHDEILNAFAAGKYDILLGTQMVAKGHDVRNVTAVGIISADTAINLPDFRAAERTFNLLTQAAGRAGRGDLPGRVVVQTYNPEHYAIQAGARHDYLAFYQEEVAYRRELEYPPFTRLIKLTVQGTDEARSRRRAEEMTRSLTGALAKHAGTTVLGPFAAPVAKIKDIFRMHIIIKTADLAYVRKQLKELGVPGQADIITDIDPLNIM